MRSVLWVVLNYAALFALMWATREWGGPVVLIALVVILGLLAWGWTKAVRDARRSGDPTYVGMMIVMSAIGLIGLVVGWWRLSR